MNQELIALGPEYWTILDLDQPTPECPMPEPIRPEGSAGVWHTCRHCGITYILTQCSDDDGDWQERWVNSHQHDEMNRVMDQYEVEGYYEYRDFY